MDVGGCIVMLCDHSYHAKLLAHWYTSKTLSYNCNFLLVWKSFCLYMCY